MQGGTTTQAKIQTPHRKNESYFFRAMYRSSEIDITIFQKKIKNEKKQAMKQKETRKIALYTIYMMAYWIKYKTVYNVKCSGVEYKNVSSNKSFKASPPDTL